MEIVDSPENFTPTSASDTPPIDNPQDVTTPSEQKAPPDDKPLDEKVFKYLQQFKIKLDQEELLQENSLGAHQH